MKKLLFILLSVLFFSCEKDDIGLEKVRVGAICRDGSRTSSTGQGTCSYHGGVKEWIYGIPTPSNDLGRNY